MKVVKTIVDDMGRSITDPKEILEKECNFYGKLYSSNLDKNNLTEYGDKFFTDNINIPKLDVEDKMNIEEEFQEAEFLNCLNTFSSNKAPGTDGLPAEFYKFFWADISKFLITSYNYSLLNGNLSIMQRQGVISLLPKKGKDEKYLKNWRPITLLNTDYKILTKALAFRFKKVIPKLLHSDQTGFIEGRYIGENINKLTSIIDYINSNKLSAYLLVIDFEKAFDCLEWPFIQKCLKFFNFGDKICSWVNTLYRNCSSCVINNGHFSQFFQVTRGVRQGCPLSPYLFVICVEMLAIAIRNNKNIKGVNINGEIFKILQYADDTTLTLSPGVDNIDNALSLFRSFELISGLKINIDKTELLEVGKQEQGVAAYFDHIGIKKVSEAKILGVKISNDMYSATEDSYYSQVDKMKRILQIWRMRNMTSYGKIVLIKSQAISQLIYLMSVLPNAKSKIITTIESELFHFIWDNKPDKIARKTIYSTYNEGGLNMPHIRTQCKALKIAWIKRLLAGDPKIGWRFLVFNSLKINDSYIFYCNTNSVHTKELFRNSNVFWYDVLEAWCSYNFFHPESLEEILSQSLWFNSYILIGKNVVYFQLWFNKNIRFVKDIVKKVNGIYKLCTYKEICNKYNAHLGQMSYNSLISAIPKPWLNILHSANADLVSEPFQYKVHRIIRLDKVTNVIYQELLKTVTEGPNKAIETWNEKLDINKEDLFQAFSFIRQSCKCPKTNFFQFKLLHYKIYTNSLLYKLKMVETYRCTFCELELETILHLLWDCSVTKNVWLAIEEWLIMKKIVPNDFKLTLKLVILGYAHSACVNNVLMTVKYYIYRCKCMNNTPNGVEAISTVVHYIAKERAAAKYSDTLTKFSQKWNKLANL